MNRHRPHTRFAATLVSSLTFAVTSAWGAGECWLDIFDKTDFQGSHVRLEGPVELPTLQKLDGRDWSDRIESLKVGDKASVTAYRHENFRVEAEAAPAYHGEALKAWGEKPEAYGDQEIIFGPGKKEHHLGELQFHQNIKSLRVNCLR